jgi:hypothetical protein
MLRGAFVGLFAKRCGYVLNLETLGAHTRSTGVAVNNVWSKEKLEMSTKIIKYFLSRE